MKPGNKIRNRMMFVLTALALVASACGGAEVVEDGGDDEASATQAGGETAAPTEDDTGADATEEGTAAESPSGEPILIGSLHPLTGGLAEDGTPMDDAVKMAVDDINEAGGIASMDGAPLEVLSSDSEGDPQVGQTEAQRMFDEGVVALVGPYQSAVAVNVAALAERSGVPFLIDVGVADAIITENSQYTFRIQPNASEFGVQGAANLAAIAEVTGESIDTVAHLHDETEFGTSINESLVEAAPDVGIDVVESIAFDPFGATDLTTALTRVASAGVDVLAVTGYFQDGVLVARDAMAVEPDVKAVVGIGSGAFSIPAFMEDSDGAGELYMNSNYHYDATNPRTQEVRERYEERFGRAMPTPAVLAYQQVEIVAEGLEAAGSTDLDAVRDGISGVSIDDPLIANDGPIEFDETGENSNAIAILMQMQEGEAVQVYPEEFKEADIQFPGVPWKSEG